MINRFITGAVCLFTVIITVIGACGCMDKNKKMTVEDALTYMEDKYGEKFSFSEAGAYQSNRNMTLYVKNENYPNGDVYVSVEKIKDENVYHDNLVAVKYRERMEKLFAENAEAVLGECRIVSNDRGTTLMPDTFGKDTSFEEYISSPKSCISLSVLIPPSHSDEKREEELDALAKKLAAGRFACTFNLYYANDDEQYKNITLPDMHTYRNWYTNNGQATVRGDGTIEPYLWR